MITLDINETHGLALVGVNGLYIVDFHVPRDGWKHWGAGLK